MEYRVHKNDIIITQPDFDLAQTLDCGQAFRWQECENGYSGFAGDRFLRVSQVGDVFTFHDTSEGDFLGFWAEYFDLYTDYSALKEQFSKDATMREACEYAKGIRLLRQDPWEALISFIISQNNNIPRIKGIISRLCELFGGRFPTAEDICSAGESGLAPIRAGFRSRYIVDCARKVLSKEVDLEYVSICPIDEARAILMRICGVGIKVAECALLFGFHRIEAFPVDVWIKRVMAEFYPNGLPDCVLGAQGIAQQFLFHYIRTSPNVVSTFSQSR